MLQTRPLKGFPARIDLVRYEWHSILRQHPQTKTLRYVSERRELAVRTDRITLGEGPYDYTYTRSAVRRLCAARQQRR